MLALGARVNYGGSTDVIIIFIPDGKLLLMREFNLTTVEPNSWLRRKIDWFMVLKVPTMKKPFKILLGLLQRSRAAADNFIKSNPITYLTNLFLYHLVITKYF